MSTSTPVRPPLDAAGPLRVALVGYGLAGAAFHAPLIAVTPGLRLAAVVTGDPERQRQVRRAFPEARLLPDADALWAERDAVDLVVVAAPNRAHVPLARASIAAGLAVVVDKPLALTAAEARGLVEEAGARGVFLGVYQNRRWDGDFLTVRRLVREGALGDVLRVESRFERWRPEPRAGWRERGAPEEGGGLLYDLGSHLVDQALVLSGPVTHVYCEQDRRRAGVEVDDDTFVALTHASGARSHLWMSAVAAQPGPRFRVLGTRAAYVKHGLDPQEAELRAGGTRADRDGWGAEPEAAWGTLGAGDAVRPVATEAGAYPRFYAGVERALRTGGPSPVDPADAVATLAVLDAARRSAAAGTVVPPEPVP
jgi:predicted dehydrogenase